MKSNETFLKEIYKKYRNTITVLDEYKGANNPILYKCNKCGNIKKARPSYLLQHKGFPCYICERKRITFTLKEIQEKVKDIDIDYIVNTEQEYKNTGIPIIFIHKTCGMVFKMRFDDFKRGQRCPVCSNKNRGAYRKITREIFTERLGSIHPQYELLGEFKDLYTKVSILDHDCGRVFYMTPDNLLEGCRCPCQRFMSSGEQKIEKYLKDNDIEYIKQYKFSDCKNIRELPFDFYLPRYNIAIEYDGQQHFYPVSLFGGEEAFQIRVCLDKYKTEYCKNNDIKLIRISYKENKNISQILKESIQ